MPEGDTLARTAEGLRPHLVGRVITAASARNGAQVQRLVGATVDSVEAVGKNLLIRCSNGLEVRTHLRMNGTWHRYRPGEPWRRPSSRAVLVIEVPEAVAVCFDAPVVELFETRAEVLHPALSALGPDLIPDEFDEAEALRRLRDPARAETTIAEALLDQRAIAGIGNVYRSEILFIERVDPFARSRRWTTRPCSASSRPPDGCSARTRTVVTARSGRQRKATAGPVAPRCGSTVEPVARAVAAERPYAR